MTFNNTDTDSFGVDLSGNSGLRVLQNGVYNIQFSAQLNDGTNPGNGIVFIWFRKNGTDIPESNTKITLDNQTSFYVAAWNYMLSLEANDYIEIIWYSEDSGLILLANSGAPTTVSIPSVIATVQQVMYTQLGPTGLTGPTGNAYWDPSGVTGISYINDVYVGGKLYVAGGIDPTYLALTPQIFVPPELSPGVDGNGIWIENGGALRVQKMRMDDFSGTLNGYIDLQPTLNPQITLSDGATPSTINEVTLNNNEINLIDYSSTTTTSFSTTSLSYTTAGPTTITATWDDIISGAASNNTLQKVLDAGNTASNVSMTLSSASTSLQLNPTSAFLATLETPSINIPTTSAQLNNIIGSYSYNIDFTWTDSTQTTQSTGVLKQDGDIPNTPASVKPVLELYHADNFTTNDTTKYGINNITLTSTGTPNFNIDTTSTGIFGWNSLTSSLNASTFLMSNNTTTNNEFTNITQLGMLTSNSGSDWYSFYRASQAVISNVAGTIFTQITKSLINIVNPTTGQITLSPADISITSSASGAIGSAVLRGLGRLSLSTASTVGYTTDYILELTNSNPAVGNTTGVPSVSVYKSGRNAVAGDTIASNHIYAKNSAGTKKEFARIETSVRTSTATQEDGSIGFFGALNGTMTEMFRMNSADNRNTCYTALDMSSNSIITTTGNLTLDASGSSGTGNIYITPKSAASIIFSEQLVLPSTPGSTSFSGAGILTCDFLNKSTGIFTCALSGANMTGISFSNPLVGGQYVIYVTASDATRTIASTLTGTANRTNYTSAVSVTTTTSALLTVTFDGTRYLIACSAFN